MPFIGVGVGIGLADEISAGGGAAGEQWSPASASQSDIPLWMPFDLEATFDNSVEVNEKVPIILNLKNGATFQQTNASDQPLRTSAGIKANGAQEFIIPFDLESLSDKSYIAFAVFVPNNYNSAYVMLEYAHNGFRNDIGMNSAGLLDNLINTNTSKIIASRYPIISDADASYADGFTDNDYDLNDSTTHTSTTINNQITLFNDNTDGNRSYAEILELAIVKASIQSEFEQYLTDKYGINFEVE